MSQPQQLDLPMRCDPIERCERRLIEIVDAEFGAASTLVREFVRWRRANPDVWRTFERYTEVMARDRGRLGAAEVWEEMRRDSARCGRRLELNNSWKPYLARLWHLVHPERGQLFRLRSIGPGRERHRV